METPSTGQATWTVARLLSWTRDYFEQNALGSPRLCAEILLADALGCERINLYTRFEQTPAPEVLDRFRASVRQAADGRPIAYLVGRKEFFSLSFRVTPDVLIPRPETEVLVERTLDLVRRAAGRVESILDLGTGSGCIVVALARHLKDVAFFASDVSAKALEVAQDNARTHGVADRIEFRCGGTFEPWVQGPPGGDAAGEGPRRFDVVVSNPPYIGPQHESALPVHVRDHEPAEALYGGGADGLDTIRAIVAGAPRHLNPGGQLLLEVAFDQSPGVRSLFEGRRWYDPVSHRDGLNHERVVQARLREDADKQLA